MRNQLTIALFISALITPATLTAQSLRESCASITVPNYRAFCQNVVDAASIVQPRLGIALAGGNPVPGAASTLGMRVRTLPRIGLAARVTAAELDLPPIERVTTTSDIEFSVGSISADVSVGVFPGFSLTPNIGGFASLDVIGSIGTIPLPRGEGFDDSSPLTWAAGARVGLLRESFAAPGASISVMMRKLGDVVYGSEDLSDRDAFLSVTNYSLTTARLLVGKRILGVGLAAGAGYDRSEADLLIRVRNPLPNIFDPSRTLELHDDDRTESRASLFANASVTFLIVSAVAELGWLQGGDAIEGATNKLSRKALFGGLAIRIGI